MRALKSFFVPVLVILVALVSSLAPANLTMAADAPSVVQHSISAGTNSTCALRASNAIYCVGDNSFGQLGDGTKIDSSEPVRVVGLDAALSVSEGKSFGCAIGVNQFGYCWGDNTFGQLGSIVGNGSAARRIDLNSTLADIQVGDDFACALTQDAKIYCWGNTGELSGTSNQSSTPTALSAVGVTTLSVGAKGLCLVTTAVYCQGQLPFTSSLDLVSGTEGSTAVSVGKDFACAVVSSSVKCWGDNSQGQLGQGNTTATSGAVTVNGITDVKVLSAGEQFACVLNHSGTSFCWGDNSKNQIAPTAQDQTTRVPTTFTSAADITSGASYVCVLLLDANIKCLGDNAKAQSAYLLSSADPLGPIGIGNLVKVSTGSNTTCAIDAAGNLYCWGANVPTLTPGQTFTDVSVGSVSACAVATSGSVLCWGSNGSSQLGDGTNKSTLVPTSVLGFGSSKAEHIAAGYRHFCASTKDGLVYCWGDNSHQQLGYVGLDAKTATAVAGIGTATNITSGTYHSCALLAGNAVYCWGDNLKKQISITGASKLGVTTVTQSAAVTEVRAGGNETCFLMVDAKLNCIGDNTDLQSPGTLTGTYSDVAVGLNSVCVSKASSSQVACFGSNTNSKLGRAGIKSATPTDVSNLIASSLAVGDENACAIVTGSYLKCWGSNSDGQLASSFGYHSAYAQIIVCFSGSSNIGETINSVISSSEPYATASTSWYRLSSPNSNGALMQDLTGDSYEITKNDLSRYFNTSVVLSKWGTSSSAFKSPNIGPVAPQIRILVSAIPTVTGKTKVGQILTANAGVWEGGVKFAYQWYRGTAKITTAKSPMYKLVAADVGKQISVSITGSKLALPTITLKSNKTSKIVR